MSGMTVSFAVVALNASATIDALFDCLRRQTYPHDRIEVILVDSASADDTRRKMERFCDGAADFQRVVVLDNPGKILPCGCNVALKAATGDAVLRVDAHTTLPDDFIALNVRNLEKGEDICGGKVISVPADRTKWSAVLNEAENSMFGGSFAAFRRADTVRYVSAIAFAIYRKSVFDKVGLYNEALTRTEDNDMHYRMKQAGYRFYYDPEIVSKRETRGTLRGLLRQKYLNGYWIGRTLAVQPRCFSVYHFVPLLFVLAIFLAAALALCGVTWPGIALACAYGCANAAMTVMTVIGSPDRNISFICLPVIFFLLHVCYGAGTVAGIVGLFRKPHDKRGKSG